MKRDDDFMREMLFEAEGACEPFLVAPLTKDEDHDEIKRYLHAKWLCDAGFFFEINEGVFRMTNQGHDFLVAIRDDTRWNRTKNIASGVGGLTLDIMKGVAVGLLKQKLMEIGVQIDNG